MKFLNKPENKRLGQNRYRDVSSKLRRCCIHICYILSTVTGLWLDFFSPCPENQRREGKILEIFLFLILGLLQNLLQLLFDTTLVIVAGCMCI